MAQIWPRVVIVIWHLILAIPLPAAAQSAEAHIAQGRALAIEGRLDDALIVFQRTLEESPQAAEAAYSMAVVHEKRGELKEAIAAYRKAVLLQENNPDVHFYLGVLLDKVGDKDSSAMALRKARDLTDDHDHRHANYWLSAVLEDLEDRAGAFDAYKDVYSIAHRFEPWNMFGHSDLDAAMHQFRSALALRLNIVDIANRVGLMLSRKGYYTRAVLEFHTALREDSKNVRTLNNLGLTYGRSGDLARAIGEFQKAIELRPDYVPARANLATALERSGDPYGAATEYQKLAEVYQGQGKLNDAARTYRKYLHTMPDESANAEQRAVVKKLPDNLER